MKPHSFIRLLLGLTWLTLGALKLGSLDTLEHYIRHTLPLGSTLATALAAGVVALEIGLGSWLLWSLYRTPSESRGPGDLLASGLAAATSALFVLAISQDAPSCGCFGAALEASRGARLAVAGAIGFLSFAGVSLSTPREGLAPDGEV